MYLLQKRENQTLALKKAKTKEEKDKIQENIQFINNRQGLIKDDLTKEDAQKFNFITVPKGGEFKLVLSDGTKVFLKSESQLKYPKKFIKGETRKIELVYGEAFFDVASNKDYDSNFIVITDGKEINASGTQLIKK